MRNGHDIGVRAINLEVIRTWKGTFGHECLDMTGAVDVALGSDLISDLAIFVVYGISSV
jgi:hypothetical protein